MSGLATRISVSFRISAPPTHGVVSPRADNVRQVGARVEEQVVAPLLVTDVEGGAVDVDSENETDEPSFRKKNELNFARAGSDERDHDFM